MTGDMLTGAFHRQTLTEYDLETLDALVTVYDDPDRDGGYQRATIRGVAAELGLTISPTHKRLRRLRWRRLAHWQTGTDGTLRPLRRVVAVFPEGDN